MGITIQKKKAVNKVFKITYFFRENVLINIFTDEIFYVINRNNVNTF